LISLGIEVNRMSPSQSDIIAVFQNPWPRSCCSPFAMNDPITINKSWNASGDRAADSLN
jgi:hypothetical protein